MGRTYQDLKETLSDLALDAERAYAIQLAIWQALRYGNLDSSAYDMGQDALSELLRALKEQLGELIS